MLSVAECIVLREVRDWRARESDWVGRQVQRINRPIKELSKLMYKVPGIEWTLDNLISGVVRIANEVAQDTLSRQGVFERYRLQGLDVDCIEDIRSLDITAVNSALDGVQVRYQSVTGAQGAAAGLAGLAGILPDLLGLVAFSLRASGEIATCCGFDLSTEHEREYALYTLYVAACKNEVEHNDAAAGIAHHHTRQTAEQFAIKGSMHGIARALGLRLISLKGAQFLPVAGMVVGGGSNAWYTARVCETARNMYRERLIHSRHPARVIEAFEAQ